MSKTTIKYATQILHELKETPEEYLPHVLQILQAFKKATALKATENSFRRAWKEVKSGKTRPLSELWVDIDAK